ncbi:Uncharacterised protein [uncultured archaeon]|nr:Uncharacterised protein [uncultured archaeon]
MDSPVCMPIGSIFSILHITIHVSFLSRITSYSNSFHPMMLSSMSTWWILESSSPRPVIASSSSLVRAMPPPAPPRVYAGRIISGSPSSFISSSASSRLFTAFERGTFSPMLIIFFLNRSRSSESIMAWSGVPRSSTPNLSNTPISASSDVILSPVWPPSPAIMPSGLSRSIIFSTISGSSGSIYMESAISVSVIMVAGLLLTRTTFIPSSRSERHAWLPEKSNSAAWPIIMGPEPIRRTFLISGLFGILPRIYLIFRLRCHDLLLNHILANYVMRRKIRNHFFLFLNTPAIMNNARTTTPANPGEGFAASF